MQKKSIKSMITFIVAILTVIILVFAFDKWLSRQIDSLYVSGTDSFALNDNQKLKEPGTAIIEKDLKNNSLIIMGSSELGSLVPENPKFMFPNTQVPHQVSLLGIGNVQNLSQGIKIAGTGMNENDKLAYIISPQWFLGEDMNNDAFAATFSEIRFYNMIKSTKLQQETKKKICSRVYELLYQSSGYEDVKVFSRCYASDTIIDKAILTVLKPYYSAKEKLLSIKDKWALYQSLKISADVDTNEIPSHDWDSLEEIAQSKGEKVCTNNDFYIEDNYFNRYIKDNMGQNKNMYANDKLQSKEIEDYELFLQICKETGVKPYIIIAGTNGRYYDYSGLEQETRQALYRKLEQKAKEYGFDSLSLADKEYEPYFMFDIMHLGWKGWLYVDHKISDYFDESNK